MADRTSRGTRRHKIIAVFIGLFAAFVFAAPGHAYFDGQYYIEPEYERGLQAAVFSMDLDVGGISIFKDILTRLPKYTVVNLLVPEGRKAEAEEEIKKLRMAGRVKVVPFSVSTVNDAEAYLLFPKSGKVYSAPMTNVLVPRGSVWAQDLFEAARTENNERVIVAPGIDSAFFSVKGWDGESRISDNAFLEGLSSAGYGLKRLPITFKGGNVLIDNRGGRRIAFVGGDVLTQTKNVLKETEGAPEFSDEAVTGMIRSFFGVEEVVVIGRGRQPSRMFHIDQAMVLLSDGVAAVTHLSHDDENVLGREEIREVEKFLSELREKLTALGYRIVNMENTAEDAMNYRYYVNGVPYRNAKTGKREFLLPVFDGQRTGRGNNILNRNIFILESLGYKVITVPTRANRYQGGIHCLINVISEGPYPPMRHIEVLRMSDVSGGCGEPLEASAR